MDLRKDASEVSVSDAQLSTISDLCRSYKILEGQIEDLEQKLTEYKEQFRLLREERLPAAMKEAGTLQFTTSEGRKVTVKPFYTGTISESRAQEAFAWLKEHGHDDIIKNDVVVKFGKGNDELAKSVVTELVSKGLDVNAKKYVHYQTLSAFIKERITSGDSTFDPELFQVYSGERATVS